MSGPQLGNSFWPYPKLTYQKVTKLLIMQILQGKSGNPELQIWWDCLSAVTESAFEKGKIQPSSS